MAAQVPKAGNRWIRGRSEHAMKWWRQQLNPVVVDAGLTVAAAGFALAVLALDPESAAEAGPLAVGLSVTAPAALMMRRRHPVVVVVLTLTARLVLTAQADNALALAPAVVIALYTVASAENRRRDLAIVLVSVTVAAVAAVSVERTEPFLEELVGEIALMLLPLAVGEAVLSRARQMRQAIEAEAAARVQAERLRIARDLHDVVAHALSTIAVQSGVAAHLLETRPQHAREALEIINATGKASLEELRGMVGVLRSTDDVPLRPTPREPDDLTVLLDGAADAGLTVTTLVSGSFPPDTSEAAVVAVHRIVQEALTNVSRHAGPVPATVTLTHTADGVTIRVVNERAGSPVSAAPTSGTGIVGMTERAASLGSTLSARSRPHGGFEIEATVPYHPRSR